MSAARFPHPLPETAPLPPVADAEFDQMAALTKRVLAVPFALVTLVTSECQVFPGLAADAVDPELEASRTNELSFSLCQYVVRGAEPFVVPDTGKVDFLADNLSVRDLGIAAYAGMPLVDRNGVVFGSLCAMDFSPRDWSRYELDTLGDLATACSAQFQLREVATRAAVSADRDRIARELGERVIGDLFRLSMTLGSVRSQLRGSTEQDVAAAIASVDDVITRIRDSVFDVNA